MTMSKINNFSDENSAESGSSFIPIFLKLPPKNIVFLKFILESYEGLGIVRTLNRPSGEVVILALKDTQKTIFELLASLPKDYGFQIIDGSNYELSDESLLRDAD